MIETVIYENVTFNIEIIDAFCDVGLFPKLSIEETDGIGGTVLTIPSNHIIGMKRDGYYIEAEYNGKTFQIPPHTDIYDYKDYYNISVNSEIHESVNIDLHIVYFKWLLSKKKKYIVDIKCHNLYWIFHDICHGNDVAGSEVCCLSASLEQYRLDEAIELMVEAGYTPNFTEYEIEMMEESFWNRWKIRLDTTKFKQYIEKEKDVTD